MKKSVLVNSIVLGVIGVSGVVGGSVFADDTQTQTTNATAALTQPGTTPGGSDNLKLESAPTFDFGSQELSGTGNTFNEAATVTGDLTVNNIGNTSGWNVTVARSEFLDGSTTLKGADLKLEQGTVSATSSDNTSTAPTTMLADLKNTSAAPVFTAAAGNGIGEWKDVFAVSNASLYAPAGNVAGNYTASLTWTLTNAPA